MKRTLVNMLAIFYLLVISASMLHSETNALFTDKKSYNGKLAAADVFDEEESNDEKLEEETDNVEEKDMTEDRVENVEEVQEEKELEEEPEEIETEEAELDNPENDETSEEMDEDTEK